MKARALAPVRRVEPARHAAPPRSARAGPDPAAARGPWPAAGEGLQHLFGSGRSGPLPLVSQPGDADEHDAERMAGKWIADAPQPMHADGASPQAHPSNGVPLPRPFRSHVERASGEDLGAVRLHVGPSAARAARSISARAFTHGPDIVFGEGRYAPHRPDGQRLLAHELAHVVQQRRTGVSRIDRDAEPDAATPTAALPADVRIEQTFNPFNAAHNLIRAIDQEDVKLVMDDPDDRHRIGVMRWARHVNFEAVVEILSDRSAVEIDQIADEYRKDQKRSLDYDLFGGGESGCFVDLSTDQLHRLRVLLSGTKASGADDAELAAKHHLEGDVAELHGLLKGRLDATEVERVMTLLRRTPEQSSALIEQYALEFSLYADLGNLGLDGVARAGMLLAGTPMEADAYVVSRARARIRAIDAELYELRHMGMKDQLILSLQHPGSASYVLTRQVDLGKERKQQLSAIEDRALVTAGDARKEAQSLGQDVFETEATVRQRVATVLGAGAATEAGGISELLLNGIANSDPADIAVARLRRLEDDDQLTAENFNDTLRGLRVQARHQVELMYPEVTPLELGVREQEQAEDWFKRFRDTWDRTRTEKEPTFEKLLARGDTEESLVKTRVFDAAGKLDDVDELVLALAGDRKDLETVKRVLRDKNAGQVAELKALYKARTRLSDPPDGRSLDLDLFGNGVAMFGTAEPQAAVLQLYGYTPGKATGTDRLVLEDYMQRPSAEGGMEEVDYLLGRAEREYRYTIDHRGATGWWRDVWGAETRHLLDASIEEVRRLVGEYRGLTTWGTNPLQVDSERAHAIIHRLNQVRSTIRGDREAYEKANAELRAKFEAVAAIVLQVALAAVLGPLAEAVFLAEAAEMASAAASLARWTVSTGVNLASTVIANRAVYGEAYDAARLLADLKGGLAGSIGSAGASKLMAPFASTLEQRLGATLSKQLISGIDAYANMKTTALVQGEDVTATDFLKQLAIGHLSEKATKRLQSGLGISHAEGTTARADTDEAMRPGETGSHEDTTAPPAGGAIDRAVPAADTGEPRPTSMALPDADAPSSLPSPMPSRVPQPDATPKPVRRFAHTTPRKTAAAATPEPVTTTTPSTARPDASSASEATPVLVDRAATTRPISDEPTRTDERQGSDVERSDAEPRAPGAPPTRSPSPDMPAPVPTGKVTQVADPHDMLASWKQYQDQIAADPTREVALVYNERLDEWAIVQGDERGVPTGKMRAHGWQVADYRTARHSHPVGAAGVTPPEDRAASGHGGDLAVAAHDAAKGMDPRSALHAIDITTEGGVHERLLLSYDVATKEWKLLFRNELGHLQTEPFANYQAYSDWYETRFGTRPDITPIEAEVAASERSAPDRQGAPADASASAPKGTRPDPRVTSAPPPQYGAPVKVTLETLPRDALGNIEPLLEGVVYEFEDGDRVWREGDAIRHDSTLRAGRGRQNTEMEMLTASKTQNPDLAGMERTHTLGQGTGFESPFGIYYAPREVNQIIQNNGIEELFRGFAEAQLPGETFHVATMTTTHPGSLRLKEIRYRLEVSTPDGHRGLLFEYAIEIGNENLPHPKITHGITQITDQAAMSGYFDMVDVPERVRTRLQRQFEHAAEPVGRAGNWDAIQAIRGQPVATAILPPGYTKYQTGSGRWVVRRDVANAASEQRLTTRTNADGVQVVDIWQPGGIEPQPAAGPAAGPASAAAAGGDVVDDAAVAPAAPRRKPPVATPALAEPSTSATSATAAAMAQTLPVASAIARPEADFADVEHELAKEGLASSAEPVYATGPDGVPYLVPPVKGVPIYSPDGSTPHPSHYWGNRKQPAQAPRAQTLLGALHPAMSPFDVFYNPGQVSRQTLDQVRRQRGSNVRHGAAAVEFIAAKVGGETEVTHSIPNEPDRRVDVMVDTISRTIIYEVKNYRRFLGDRVARDVDLTPFIETEIGRDAWLVQHHRFQATWVFTDAPPSGQLAQALHDARIPFLVESDRLPLR